MESNQHPTLSTAEISQRAETIWNEVLNAASHGRDATFFELSGQSIAAVRIVARVAEEIGAQIDLGDLFEDPDLDTFVRDVVAKASNSTSA